MRMVIREVGLKHRGGLASSNDALLGLGVATSKRSHVGSNRFREVQLLSFPLRACSCLRQKGGVLMSCFDNLSPLVGEAPEESKSD